jgi:hypothetical protein
MAFDVSALSNYTEENKQELITKTIFGGKTIGLMEVQAGIKSTETINIMDTDAVFQAGGTCGRTPSGTTSITQRPITVGKLRVDEDICPETLEAKYTQKYLSAGAKYDSVAFAAEWAARKIAKINNAMEVAVWQGDTGSGNVQLNKFDGLLKVIDAASGVVDGNLSSATSITDSNIIAIHHDIFATIPSELLNSPELVILQGWDTFRKLQIKLTTNNWYQYNGESNNGELVMPGTNIRIIAVHGLNSTNRIIAAEKTNLYFGTDLLNDYEDFNTWYSQDDEVVKFSVKWKAGVQVAFPSQIVEFTPVVAG